MVFLDFLFGSKTRLINTFQVNVRNTQRQKTTLMLKKKPCVNSQSKKGGYDV